MDPVRRPGRCIGKSMQWIIRLKFAVMIAAAMRLP